MIYYDYYLKTTSQSALRGILRAAGLATVEPQDFLLNEGVLLDEFEEYEQTGVDAEGLPVMKKKAGYFANLRTAFPVETALPMIQPAVPPYRVWFGGMNYVNAVEPEVTP